MTLLLEYPLRTDLPRYDDEEVLVATVECVRCGAEVKLTATPCEWTEQEDGSTVVTDVGPAMGDCCGLLYVDAFGEVNVYEESELRASALGPRCRGCGCTEDNPCPGACFWVEPDLCSRCA